MPSTGYCCKTRGRTAPFAVDLCEARQPAIKQCAGNLAFWQVSPEKRTHIDWMDVSEDLCVHHYPLQTKRLRCWSWHNVKVVVIRASQHLSLAKFIDGHSVDVPPDSCHCWQGRQGGTHPVSQEFQKEWQHLIASGQTVFWTKSWHPLPTKPGLKLKIMKIVTVSRVVRLCREELWPNPPDLRQNLRRSLTGMQDVDGKTR